MSEVGKVTGQLELARYYHSKVVPAMDKLREAVDNLETIVGNEFWAYPDYGQILFGIE